jgi:hypothetical protein
MRVRRSCSRRCSSRCHSPETSRRRPRVRRRARDAPRPATASSWLARAGRAAVRCAAQPCGWSACRSIRTLTRARAFPAWAPRAQASSGAPRIRSALKDLEGSGLGPRTLAGIAGSQVGEPRGAGSPPWPVHPDPVGCTSCDRAAPGDSEAPHPEVWDRTRDFLRRGCGAELAPAPRARAAARTSSPYDRRGPC